MNELQWYINNLGDKIFKRVEQNTMNLNNIIFDFSYIFFKIMGDYIENREVFDKANKIIEIEEKRDF